MGKARTSSGNCKGTRKWGQRFQVEGVISVETSIVDESGSEKRTTEVDHEMLNKPQESNSGNPLLYIPPKTPRGTVKRTVRYKSRQRRSSGNGRGRREKTALETTKGGTDRGNDVAVMQHSLAGSAIHGKQYVFNNSRGSSNHGLLNGYPVGEITSKQENVPIKGKELPEGGHAVETGTLECVNVKHSVDLEPHSVPEELSNEGPVVIAELIGISVEKRTNASCDDASKESRRKQTPEICNSLEGFDPFQKQESTPSPMEQPAVVQNSQASGKGTLDSTVDTGRNELTVQGNRPPFCTARGPSGVDMRLNLIPVGSAPLLERAVIRTSGLVPMTLLASFIHCSLRLPGEQSISLRCCGVDLGSVMALTLQQFTKCIRMESGGILELEYEIQ